MFSSEAGRAAAGSLKLGTPKKDFVLVKVRVDLGSNLKALFAARCFQR